MKILIAEDDSIARRVLSLFLEPYGAVEAVASGEEAITQFKTALEHGSPYMLLCLDIRMPGLAGLEVLKQIRELERTTLQPEPVIVLMITGSAADQEIAQARALGARGFILKPIIEHELIEHLRQAGIVPN